MKYGPVIMWTAYRAHEIAYCVAGLLACAALWALHCYLDWRDFREVDRRNRLRAALRRLREERRAAALRESAPR